MRAIFFGLLLVGCARVETLHKVDLIVTVQSRLDRDVCAVHLWSDADLSHRAENRLLPEEELLDSASPYRLHAGERRDFVFETAEPLHLEALACDGTLLAKREVDAAHASLTLAAR